MQSVKIVKGKSPCCGAEERSRKTVSDRLASLFGAPIHNLAIVPDNRLALEGVDFRSCRDKTQVVH
jgi:hypothetical protein